ncbi:MAG: hypothetical protein ACRBFS_21710 [Aureispira sp.]
MMFLLMGTCALVPLLFLYLHRRKKQEQQVPSLGRMLFQVGEDLTGRKVHLVHHSDRTRMPSVGEDPHQGFSKTALEVHHTSIKQPTDWKEVAAITPLLGLEELLAFQNELEQDPVFKWNQEQKNNLLERQELEEMDDWSELPF